VTWMPSKEHKQQQLNEATQSPPVPVGLSLNIRCGGEYAW